MRVVSLFPSATEVVAGVGGAPLLVGRSHRCNYPSTITDVPVVTQSSLAVDDSRDVAAIDASIDDHRHGTGSFYRVLEAPFQATEPDVVITQSLCEVCAVPESVSTAAMEQLDVTPELVSLSPTTVEGMLDSIREVGSVLERESEAARLERDLRSRIEAVRGVLPEREAPPRVVCLEWTDALRCHGLWIPDILDRLGAEDGFGEAGAPGRVIEWEAVREYDPEVLIISPCGRTLPQIREDVSAVMGRPGWEALTAVSEDRVYLLDGELSSRHGPRVVRALELLATMIYPELREEFPWQAGEAAKLDPIDVP